MGNELVAGIAGATVKSTQITDCYNTGEITGNEDVAGIAGLATNIVTKCYNTGTITGNIEVGGIVGDCFAGIPQNISLCYNTGTEENYRVIIENMVKEVQKTEVDLKTFEEFLSWIEQQ